MEFIMNDFYDIIEDLVYQQELIDIQENNEIPIEFEYDPNEEF